MFCVLRKGRNFSVGDTILCAETGNKGAVGDKMFCAEKGRK